jgi:ubiquinone/menaquinone biosynthesis C-methylase UbiE
VLFPTNVKARFEELFQRSWDSEVRAEVYDKFVEGGESMMDMHHHLGETRATLRMLEQPSGGMLLDCGCGNGRFFERYSPDISAVGIDASLNLLRICKKKGRATKLVCGEVEHLPFKTDVFDRVVCVRVLQHIHDQPRAVSDMVRVLRPAGELTLHCYNDASSKGVVKRIRQSRLGPILNAPFRALFRTMSPFRPWELEYDQYNTVPQVNRWLRQSGARNIGTLGTGFGFNKWLLAGFLVAKWLEKRHPAVLKRYLAGSLRTEETVGRWWPISIVMEKFVIRAVKTGNPGGAP